MQKENDELHRKNADIAHHRILDQSQKINAYEQKFGSLDSTGENCRVSCRIFKSSVNSEIERKSQKFIESKNPKFAQNMF